MADTYTTKPFQQTDDIPDTLHGITLPLGAIIADMEWGGGTAGTAANVLTIPKDLTDTYLAFRSKDLGKTRILTLSPQSFSFKLNVTVGSSDITANWVGLYANIGGTLINMGSHIYDTQTLTAGVHTFTTTVSNYDALCAVTDYIVVLVNFTNLAAHADSSVTFNFSESCAIPVADAITHGAAVSLQANATVTPVVGLPSDAIFLDQFVTGTNLSYISTSGTPEIGLGWTTTNIQGQRHVASPGFARLGSNE